MLFKDYLAAMVEMAEGNPDVMDMEVVYAIDGEGNAFHTVGWTADVGMYTHHDNEFISKEQCEEEDDEDCDSKSFVANAVCIN